MHTNDEATVYVKELDLFVTVMLLEDTPSILSRKTMRRSRIFLPLDQWSETTNKVQPDKLRTDRCPWSIDRFFQLNYSTVTAGLCSLYIASSNNTK